MEFFSLFFYLGCNWMRMLNPSLLDDLDYLKYVLECEFGLSVAEDDFCTSESVLDFASTISGLEIVDGCVVVLD